MATWNADDVLTEIGRQATDFGIDPRLAGAFFMAENSGSGVAASGNGSAVSPAGARGIMQVMPGTARGLQKAGLLPANWTHNPDDLPSQVQAGLAALKDVVGRSSNPDDIYSVAAGYNGSPAVQQAYDAGKPIPAETKQYLQKIKVATNKLGLKVGEPTVASTPTAAAGTGSITTLSGVTGDWGPSQDNGTGIPAIGTSAVGNRASVRRSVYDPIALNDFTANISAATNSVDTAAEQVIAGGQIRQVAMAGLQDAISRAGDSAAQVARISAEADAANRARRVKILTALNLNPDITDNLMLSTANVIDSTSDNMAKMKPEIDARMAVGMFDNPFQWLVNQTILPGLTAKYNNLNSTKQAAIDLYRQKQQIATAQDSISERMDADLSLQKGVALASQASAEATERLSKAQMEASASNSRDAWQLADLAIKKVGLNAEQLRLTKQTETESQSNTEKLTQQQQDERNLAGVNGVQKQIGGRSYNTWKEFMAEPVGRREELLAASRQQRYGADFGSSFALIDHHGNWQNIAMTGGAAIQGWSSATENKARELMQTDLAQLKISNPGQYQKLQVDPKEKEAYIAGKLNAIQATYQDQANNDMSHAWSGNPYKIQYQPVSRDVDLAGNPVANFIKQYGPGGTDPRYANIDENLLMDRFGYAVYNNKMPMPDAVKAITDFYKTAVQKQIMANKPTLFGMQLPDKTYAVNMNNLLNLNKSIDLGSTGDVEMALTRLVARRSKGPMDYVGAAFLGNKEGLYKQPQSTSSEAMPANLTTEKGVN